jgi:hypothetical protein
VGAWGEKTFENDAAMDWLVELEEQGVPALRTILSDVAQTAEDEYLDVDDGARAMAAGEMVAAALGQGRDRVPTRSHAWLDVNASAITERDLAMARRAVRRILTANSELRELWDDSDPNTKWQAGVRVLLTRLGGEPTALSPSPESATRDDVTARTTRQQEQSKAVLLTFLHARGLEPDEQQMERIRASRDDEEIRSWLARAVDAPSIEAVLGRKQ